ncbi:hypothetical protein K440DRAFT_302444 [Wilcoxina mikolae CBS 423.85]|nr:hypothetical protein K440DRAFT_302444 [Wilcoxina mikolae CBS 423.85]
MSCFGATSGSQNPPQQTEYPGSLLAMPRSTITPEITQQDEGKRAQRARRKSGNKSNLLEPLLYFSTGLSPKPLLSSQTAPFVRAARLYNPQFIVIALLILIMASGRKLVGDQRTCIFAAIKTQSLRILDPRTLNTRPDQLLGDTRAYFPDPLSDHPLDTGRRNSMQQQ